MKGGRWALARETCELDSVLQSTYPHQIDRYLGQYEAELLSGEREFMQYMNERIRDKKLRKQDILLKADLSLGYGYKLLAEEKVTKQRDVILRICYAAELTLDETQRGLRIYGMPTLYAREPRDAILISCFLNRPGSIIDVNELLLTNNMQPLRTSGTQD